MQKRQRELGRGVAIVGAGMSKFGAFPQKASRDLFVDAFKEMSASVDKGLDPQDIEALYVGNFSSDLFEGQGHIAPIMADWLGLLPRPGYQDRGRLRPVAVQPSGRESSPSPPDCTTLSWSGGVEKMTNLPTERVTDTLACASDILYEAPAGLTFPGIYAALATAPHASVRHPGGAFSCRWG